MMLDPKSIHRHHGRDSNPYARWKELFGAGADPSDFDTDFERASTMSLAGQHYTRMQTEEMKMKLKQDSKFSELLKNMGRWREEWPPHEVDKGPKRDFMEADIMDLPPFPVNDSGYICTNKDRNHPTPKEQELENLLRIIERGSLPHHGSARNLLAFYNPFHIHDHWGLYFFTDKLADLAAGKVREIQRDTSNVLKENGELRFSAEAIHDMVYWKTFFHEMYHHKVEMYATKLEFVLREQVYCHYFRKFYCRTYGQDLCMEEAFANVYGVVKCAELMKKTHNIDTTTTIRVIQEHFLRNASKGYRKAYDILEFDDRERKVLEREFLEILTCYVCEEKVGAKVSSIPANLYEMFTYALDPKLNINKNIIFLKPAFWG